MGSSIKRLFNDEVPLDEELRRHQAHVDDEINSLPTSALTPEEAKPLLERLSYEPVLLSRERAELQSEAVGAGVGITLRIPFEGNPEVFRHPPAGTKSTLEARVHDGSGFYTGDPSEQRNVAFERLFPGDVSATEVRDWAREVADQLEEILRRSQVLIGAFNADLAASMARRREALSNSASLAGSLGSGI